MAQISLSDIWLNRDRDPYGFTIAVRATNRRGVREREQVSLMGHRDCHCANGGMRTAFEGLPKGGGGISKEEVRLGALV